MFGLPMDHLYHEELDALRNKDRKILEVSSLASVMATEWQGVVMNFIRLVFLYSTFQNINDICIMVNPKHAGFYIKSSPFKMFGKEKFYPMVNAPAVALRANVDEIKDFYENSQFIISFEDHLSSLYRSLKIKLSCNILGSICNSQNSTPTPANPLNGELVTKMLLDDRDISDQLSSPAAKSFLKEAYPGIRFSEESSSRTVHSSYNPQQNDPPKNLPCLSWSKRFAPKADLTWNDAVLC
ncbi:hypothetical protein JCM31598_22130 [Desulfonatronum parangueonense]